MSKKEIKFPRTLYKKDGPETLCSAGKKYEYSSELVENKEEYNAAIKAGYLDDFNEALFGKTPVIEEKEEEKETDDDF